MAKVHPALAAVRKSGTQKVKVAVSDIDGILRGKYLHKDKFFGTAEPYPKGGFGFCDVVLGWDMMDNCYDNTTVTGWQHGFPDALARLDLDTARTVPWDNNVPFFLGEFVNADGTPHPTCPRQTLKCVLQRADKLGYQVMTGMEFEWYNFAETPQSWASKKGVAPEPLTPGMFGYSLLRVNQNREFFNAIMDDMLAFGVPVEGLRLKLAPDAAELVQHVTDTVRPAVALLSEKLATCAWDKASIAAAIKEVLTAHGLKMPQLAMPVRVLVVGTAQTPSLDSVLEMCGREKVIARLAKA